MGQNTRCSFSFSLAVMLRKERREKVVDPFQNGASWACSTRTLPPVAKAADAKRDGPYCR